MLNIRRVKIVKISIFVISEIQKYWIYCLMDNFTEDITTPRENIRTAIFHLADILNSINII